MYHTLMLLEAAQLPASGGRMKLKSEKIPCTNTGISVVKVMSFNFSYCYC